MKAKKPLKLVVNQSKKHVRFIVGIDEAGRGPLAGPVSVGAVIYSQESKKFLQKELRVIKNKDSKKLTPEQREIWFKKIKVWKQEKILNYAVTLIAADVIDNKGISFAINAAIKRCLKNIKADCDSCLVLLDGSLKAPTEFKNQKTIIKGDEKESVISLASIAAKITRDKKMHAYAKVFPEYSFDIHKGYGTVLHREKIKKHGISKIHRRSFLKSFI